MRGSRTAWLLALLASLAGIALTGTQIVERITVLKDPTATLACDLNSVMSCSNVLGAWQSSVILGIPNAFIGAVMFSLFLATSLAGLMGSDLSRRYLATMLGLVVFFAAFATWFMMETAFVIGALCIWCTGIITAVAVIGGALTRVYARSRPADRPDSRFARASRAGVDVMAWAGWWVLVLGLLAVGLVL
jgi:uncharacterized membrane protein